MDACSSIRFEAIMVAAVLFNEFSWWAYTKAIPTFLNYMSSQRLHKDRRKAIKKASEKLQKRVHLISQIV